MPWSETSPMDERLQFVADVRRAHESMSTLCDRYGIRRKTGYPGWARSQAEGVAGLQYLAETSDSDEVFLIAIDGITNMRTGNAATLKWAQRRALERLTARDDKLYLYEMLGELADDGKDAPVYVAALESSLAHADSRRSYVLRELLAVTAEVTTYEASQRVNDPNAKKNVAYARRLIALGEEMPPDVYVDLGRTFIKLNDPAAARWALFGSGASLRAERVTARAVAWGNGRRDPLSPLSRDARRASRRTRRRRASCATRRACGGLRLRGRQDRKRSRPGAMSGGGP